MDLTILVEIFKAWKKEISDGSSPVLPFGTVTSQGEMAPTLALCHSIRASIFGLRTDTLTSVNISATLPLICGTKAFNLWQSFYSKRSFLHS